MSLEYIRFGGFVVTVSLVGYGRVEGKEGRREVGLILVFCNCNLFYFLPTVDSYAIVIYDQKV